MKGLFFTHYHIDHTTGFGDLLSRGAQANGPDHNLKSLNVYGPEAPQVGGVNGLDVLTNGIKAGFGPGYDLHFWAKPYVGAPPHAPGPRPTVNTIKIKANPPTAMAAIPILTGDPDVRVEAIEVDHDEDFGTCYAYRFELLNAGVPTGKSVVFSGDRAHYNARRDFSSTSAYYAKGAPGEGKPAYFPAIPPTRSSRTPSQLRAGRDRSGARSGSQCIGYAHSRPECTRCLRQGSLLAFGRFAYRRERGSADSRDARVGAVCTVPLR